MGAVNLFLGCALGVIGIAALIKVKQPAVRRWLILGIAGLAVSAGGVELRAIAMSESHYSGRYHAVAVVTSDPHGLRSRVIGNRIISGEESLPARVELLDNGHTQTRVRLPVRILTSENDVDFTPGTTLEVDIRFIKRTPDFWLARALSTPRQVASASPLARGAQRIRSGLQDASSHLPQPVAGLLPGLVVGDTSRLDLQLESAMRATNLTHLTAVSGANLALVAAFLMVALRFAGVGRRLLPVFTALAIAGFVVVARPDPSVLRAAVMAGVLILASALRLPAVGLTALMVAVIALVLFDPSQSHRPGFVLSVLATAGLLLFGKSWAMRLERYMPRWLALSLAVPLAAQALCTPYLVLLSGQLSLIGVWTNLLVAPAIAPATILGFIAALVSVAWPTLATALAWIAFLPLWWVTAVARVGAWIPFANIRWAAGWLGVFMAMVLIASTYFLFRRGARYVIAAYIVFVIVLTGLRTFTPQWPMKNWALAMCDVGQGDGIVLKASDDSAIVIDVGPEPDLIDTCLHDLGIRKIPLVILTHHHADHVEGLPGLLRNRAVEQIWISPESEPEFESQRVQQWSRGMPLVKVAARQAVTFQDVRIETVWPKEMLREGSIPNNSSIVILAKWPWGTALLMADVEIEAQERLHLSGPIDVLKVAHHGSANQDFALLSRLKPSVALVSVGAVNPYGHPSPMTLQALARAGASIFRTDRDGAVAVAFDDNGLIVAARGHPWWRP